MRDMKDMKIMIFGLGGVGGVTGGVLARSHPETYFFARGRHLDAIRADGLRVRSEMFGDFTARPKLASDDINDFGTMDAILIACKGYDLKEVCGIIAPAAGPRTVIVPLLNGVTVSELMEPLLPRCILADGTIRIFSHIEGPGLVVQSSGLCRIVFGMRDGTRPAGCEDLAAVLNNAGIKTEISENILLDSWRKYVVMCSCSVMFCYYDGPAGRVREDPNHRAVLRAVVDELVSVAAARGVILPGDTADRQIENFESMPPDTVTSLYRDLSSGRPIERTELRHIIGRMVEMGEAAGIPTPYHKAALERFSSRT